MFVRIFILFFILLSSIITINAQGITNCKSCGTTLIKSQDIDTLSVDELRLLTNEIYARKGYTFTNENYQAYFESFGWYKSLGDNSLVKLSTIEEKNIKLLTDRRKAREDERQTILTYFKGLKQLAVSNNDSELNRLFPKSDHPEEMPLDKMKDVLLHIDFDDLNWYKNKALHRVTVDNGYVQIVYSFSITSEGITLMYNYMAHSEIMEAFDTPFSDYMSENEFAVWWTFSLKNGKVVLETVDMAG